MNLKAEKYAGLIKMMKVNAINEYFKNPTEYEYGPFLWLYDDPEYIILNEQAKLAEAKVELERAKAAIACAEQRLTVA